MTPTCLVLIASAELLPGLAQRVASPDSEVLTFADTETMRALETITTRHPNVVTLERKYAATPRGKALINRIKADARLAGCEVRVISPEDLPTQPPSDEKVDDATTTPTPGVAARPPIDQRGTRRALRFKIDEHGTVVIDGKSATLLDLSTYGAQIVLTKALKPNQRVQMALSDDRGVVRFNALIVWAAFEIPPRGDPRYRVGIEFIDADPAAVEAFCSRHKSTLTPEA